MAANVDETTEDTRFDEDEDETRSYDDSAHRHYDPVMETVAPGTKYRSSKSIPSARRRQHNRLAVSRTPFIQPVFGEYGNTKNAAASAEVRALLLSRPVSP